jgi:signal transduction histidine kinase
MIRRLQTVRVKLTLWYIVLLGLTLLLFSGYIALRLESSLNDQTDTALQVGVSQVISVLDTTGTTPALPNTSMAQDVSRRLTQAGFNVWIRSNDGTTISHSGGLSDASTTTSITSGYGTVIFENAEWRVYYQKIEGADGTSIGWIEIARSLEAIGGTMDHLYYDILTAVPFALILAGVGGLFLAVRALRPIDHITRTAQAISGGDLSQRIAHKGPADEIGRLTATLDSMLDRLQTAFERERQFSADVSHELRTPLTAIKGRVEVSLNQPRSPDEYEATLRAIDQDAARLIRLTTDLLLLSRLERGNLPWQPYTVDLSDLLLSLVDYIQPLVESRQLNVQKDIPPTLLVQGDLDQLMRLFLNLLDNAIKYSRSAGELSIQARLLDGCAQVAICDSGPGIAPEHIAHLFERFYRIEADRSRESGGAGLGLAIAAEIARWHKAKIEVYSAVGYGTTFTITLPLPPK